MVEGARLESVCTVILYREFESLTLRHFYVFFWTEQFVFRTDCSTLVPRKSHEPRQVWKEAALSGLLAVPWGCLGAVVCCENELVKTPWWRLFL